MRVVGIDPGLKGALAYLDIETGDCGVLDMPVSEFVDGRPVPDVYGISRILQDWQPDMIVIEHVEPRPTGQGGAASQWRFAMGFGALTAACQIICHDRVFLVRPPIWKRAMAVTADKETSLALARSLHPGMAQSLKRKKDDGRAEALLLCDYYRDHVIPTAAVECI